MRKISVLYWWVALLIGVSAIAADLPEKHPLDETVYERFVMDNGLKVLLVSDPKLDKASASMAVGAGSLMDPKDRQGLAHFLEHMLFLGTEKYPDASEYSNYLQTNGGYSNAYTSGDHTNYHFEVYPFAFEGALDRFAQFFTAPLFSQEFSDREKNAVNSEHQKNLENDSWRTYQLWRNHYNPNHPANHFSTGNLETLGDVQREEFIDFYKRYYSANQMALALVSSNSIAEMKQWVLEYFSDIKNQNSDRIRYPADYILPSDKFRLIEMVPIKDLRELSIEFPMPSYIDKFDSKSASLISYIIGYEGKGSLLSALKDKGWATGLSAALTPDTMDYSSLFITVELTPDGLQHYREIIRYFYAYVDLMKHAPYPGKIFQEQKTMARLEELYSNKGEGADRAVSLANTVLKYPLAVAERVPYLWTEPDEDSYFDLLNHVLPETMMVSLISKDLEVDQTEPIYGTPYSYLEESSDYLESLKTPVDAADIAMPAPNPFVPEEVKLLAERPIKVINEPGLVLYYSQDQEFLRPKVAVQFKIRHPEKFVTLENTVLKDFYADCVKEALNEIAYPARMAGLGYSIDSGIEGLYLTLGGYNESAWLLMDEIIREMLELNISEERFNGIKDGKIRELENFPKGDAWRIAREAKREILHEVAFTPEQQLEVARNIELEDVRQFVKKLYNKGYIEALIHGNVTRDEAVAAARKIKDRLGMKSLKKDKVFENRMLTLQPGQTALREIPLEVNNSCYWSEYFLGFDKPEVRAASLILGNYIGEPFYTEMRTNQQLGYITSGFSSREDEQYSLYFVIQSGEYPADEIRRRAETYLEGLPAVFAEIPDEAFEQLRAAAVAQVEVKSKSIGEKASGFFEMIYDLDLDFDRREESLAALKSVTKEQVAAIFAKALDPETASERLVLAFSRDYEIPADAEETPIEDVATWKSAQDYE